MRSILPRPSRGGPSRGPQLPAPRAALVIAHPGHELRVHGWLEQHKPLVFVWTDGSGSGGQSRLASTERVLRAAGARPGEIFGAFRDRELYERILAGDVALFARLIDELAAIFRRERIEIVAGDAVEGFNPGHDVGRLLLNAAVEAAGGSASLVNYEFTLEAGPRDMAPRPRPLKLRLDDGALRRKLAAARGYRELRDEIDEALARHGDEAFREEWLHPVTYGLSIAHVVGPAPWYETHGARRVTEGTYARVIRFREHIEPLAAALRSHVAGRATA